MICVDTDKNAYLRRDNDYVSVPAKYMEISRRQKDSAQILQLVMWIRTILFAVVLLSPRLHALMRIHEWILSRTRN